MCSATTNLSLLKVNLLFKSAIGIIVGPFAREEIIVESAFAINIAIPIVVGEDPILFTRAAVLALAEGTTILIIICELACKL